MNPKKHRLPSLATTGLLAAALVCTAQQAGAVTVLDDDFTGNSGGLPAGWSVTFGTGTAVESGTDLTTSDAVDNTPYVLGNLSATSNPQTTTTTVTVDVSSATASSGDRNFSFGLAGIDGTNSGLLFIRVGLDNSLSVEANISNVTSFENFPVTTVSDTTDLEVSFTFDSDSFSVSTNDGFNGLDTTFASAFTSFTSLAPLGSIAAPVLINSGSATAPLTVEWDRVTVTNTTIPEPSSASLLALLGLGFLSRRRRS